MAKFYKVPVLNGHYQYPPVYYKSNRNENRAFHRFFSKFDLKITLFLTLLYRFLTFWMQCGLKKRSGTIFFKKKFV